LNPLIIQYFVESAKIRKIHENKMLI
jgi:hypothetical protein